MPKEDLKKIARWMAYVYAPIALLIIGVFLLVEYRAHELRKLGAHAAPVTTVSDK